MIVVAFAATVRSVKVSSASFVSSGCKKFIKFSGIFEPPFLLVFKVKFGSCDYK